MPCFIWLGKGRQRLGSSSSSNVMGIPVQLDSKIMIAGLGGVFDLKGVEGDTENAGAGGSAGADCRENFDCPLNRVMVPGVSLDWR